MFCFSASFCFLCLRHFQKNSLFDINKNNIKDVKIIDVLQYCGFESNYCGDSCQVYICEKCLNRIEAYHAFKVKCSKNFTILKGYVNQMKSNANVAFHANLKVIVTDPKHCVNEPTIEYMDVSQFVETQIQSDEVEVQETPKEIIKPPEEPEIVTNVILPEVNNPIIPPEVNNPLIPLEVNNTLSSVEQLYEMSKFIYDNHFLNMPSNYDEVIEIPSSPDSFKDLLPQNSSGSFNDVQCDNMPRNHCTSCNKRYMNAAQFSVHKFLHTLLTYPDNESNKFMKYYCALCSVDLSGLPKIKSHLLTHTHDKLLTCESCSQDFINSIDFNKHFAENPSHKLHVCSICHGKYATTEKLNAHHKRKHIISCMFCKILFDTKLELKAHMVEKHNNEFCFICSKSFKTNDHLKIHLFDNHFELQTVGSDGKHQYNCPKCHAKFLTKYSLNEHLGGCAAKKKIKKKF